MSVATILIALIVVAVILLGIIITVIVKSRKVKPNDEYEDEYDDDDYDNEDDDDEEEEEEEEARPRRRRPVSQNDETMLIQVPEPQKKKKAKKQWRIIMENLDTWEKYTFIFYDNIGIGRGKRTPEFEKYISINDDPRISKLHCAIIHDGGRLYLKDMESRNGTYLNGQLLEEPVAIQKEDVIGLGQTKIEVKKILRERD